MSQESDSGAEDESLGRTSPRLRLLSYNIQSGLSTKRYSHYFTSGWKHLVPVPSRMQNLDRIAQLLSRYDLVGLQEVDAGSLRSGFLDQAHYLADRARFPHYCEQTNRRVGRISRHCNAFLSRIRPSEIRDHKLPGVIKGRGALMIRFGDDGSDASFYIFVVHLALSRRARLQQLDFLAEIVRGLRHVVMMGDMNSASDNRDMEDFRARTGLIEPVPGLRTFPSWRPVQQLDHMLVSPSLRVNAVEVLSYRYSDHLPIAMELEIPGAVRMSSHDRHTSSEIAVQWRSA